MANPWMVQAGPSAYQQLRERGWQWDDFQVVLGASGGPRWLVLSAVDRLLARLLGQRPGPIHLLGSSSGAYRFSAYIQDNPEQALAALEETYIDADWSPARPLGQIRQSAIGIVRSFLQRRPLQHPTFRLHISTSLCRGWLAREHRLPQTLGLLAACVLAAVDRKHLKYLVQRVLFSDPRHPLPSHLEDMASLRAPLTESNHFEAILASGAIPLLIPGENYVAHAPPGCLRDGGLVDYHFDSMHFHNDGLILYPHFAHSLLPGWLERFGPRRPVPPAVLDRMVLLSPSPEFIATLPGGKIPDRSDASQLGQRERRRLWREAAQRGQQLAEALDKHRFMQALKPFSS
ncbi:patatin-like phospholipase family protein [bacterium]|nr:patatin-like phospholipase family protein [bacterium]